MHHHGRVLLLLPVAALLGVHAEAAPLVPVLGGNAVQAFVHVDRSRVDQCNLGPTDSSHICSAFFGAPGQPHEVRAAARVIGGEIAANGLVVGRDPATIADLEAEGRAGFEFGVRNVSLMPQAVSVEFVIPPAEVEFTDNVEAAFGFGDLSASIYANLWIFGGTLGTSTNPTLILGLEASLVGNFNSDPLTQSILSLSVLSDVGLDLSPLQNPALTVAMPDAETKTITYGFPLFAGEVSLPALAPGEEYTVRYALEAKASGTMMLRQALAAINDPLAVTGVVTLGGYTVPEPGAPLLLAAGALLAQLMAGRRAA